MEKQRELVEKLHPLRVREGVLMSELTSFHIGGPALALVEPESYEEVLLALAAAKASGVEVFLMGNGTNLLIPDEGLNKLVIRIGESLAYVRRTSKGLEAGAGISLGALCRAAANEGLAGSEWASGIPGTVGGALAMNAGAYGGEIKDIVCRVDYLENGKLFSVEPRVGDFSYRKSAYGIPGRIVVAAEFSLTQDESEAVLSRIEDFTRRREEKQPLNYPSAGSVFKRPEGHFTGALIEAAGLKGTRVGGAMVSEKHAGFIVNAGGATYRDVLGLIRLVQERVLETSGIALETEIKIIRAEG